MAVEWLDELKRLVEKNPIAILKFDDDEWKRLYESRLSISEFTIARPHALLEGVKKSTPCLLQGKNGDEEYLCLGIVSSKAPITTLESRIKVKHAMQIQPRTKPDLLRLVTDKQHANNLKQRLKGKASVIPLSPKLSGHLIERLASISENRGAMRAVTESLSAPRRFTGTASLQEDAVRTALGAFGFTPADQLRSLDLVEGRETALARVSIVEDSVIEHDARHIPGYDLVGSDLTGRAVFERGEDRLEVFTANRRTLEHCFGVDLIYLNASKQNIVMLQYKMLEPLERGADDADWIYRPDAKLDDEIRRMRVFATNNQPGELEYRLNSTVFYLKFVKRDGLISNGGIITPLDHFEKLRKDPACRGPKKGLRVSYNSLAGRYLRQNPFLDLVRAGYIGAHAETTAQLKVLVDAVLSSERSVVVAIQQPRPKA